MTYRGMTAFLLGILLAFGAAGVMASEHQVCWTAPDQNVDGTPLTDLAGYVIYSGESSRDYTASHTINDASATCHTITDAPFTVFVAATAFDADGNESAFSNEVVKIDPAGSVPVAPTLLE